jgi:hypothetical protein
MMSDWNFVLITLLILDEDVEKGRRNWVFPDIGKSFSSLWTSNNVGGDTGKFLDAVFRIHPTARGVSCMTPIMIRE